MEDKEINIRFNYNGRFQKSTYVGGQTFVVTRVEVDLFSYTVLMEYVRDYLRYTEVGGVYMSKGKAGWELLTDDKDLIGLLEACKDGEEIEFFVDTIVDKEIEPMTQMQPHVVVRPRKNIIGGIHIHIYIYIYLYIFIFIYNVSPSLAYIMYILSF